MKNYTALLILSCTTLSLIPLPFAHAKNVDVGDPLEAVLEEFGRPSGELRKGQQQLLYYKRGEIEVFEGYVVRMEIISEQEAREKRKAMEAAAKRQQAVRASMQKALTKEGQEELARTLADESFSEMSPDEQLTYWKSFSDKYPGVNITQHQAKAETKVKTLHDEAAAQEKKERELAAANQPPVKKLSRSRLKKERRRIDPTKPVVTAEYTPEYRPLGGSIADWPY